MRLCFNFQYSHAWRILGTLLENNKKQCVKTRKSILDCIFRGHLNSGKTYISFKFSFSSVKSRLYISHSKEVYHILTATSSPCQVKWKYWWADQKVPHFVASFLKVEKNTIWGDIWVRSASSCHHLAPTHRLTAINTNGKHSVLNDCWESQPLSHRFLNSSKQWVTFQAISQRKGKILIILTK